MQIIIPMSGIGKRFMDAGYSAPKPLIEVDGKPIIEHVVNLFPGETDFIFICNKDHLKNTDMKKILTRICPTGKIVSIEPHKKGPVYAVSRVFDMIDDAGEVIINYCDFSKYWDYKNFLKHTRERDADGAIPSYRGFHPHMLGTTNYAFIRDNEQWMIEIREKEPFTDNRMNEYASDGTYYFKKGSYVKKYFTKLMDEDISVKGEYYVSMIYNLLVNDGLKVSVYEIQHMLQWGTPEDLEEYNLWSKYFSKVITPLTNISPRNKSINLIPLAGKGMRFKNENYKLPKPLIDVNGKPMIIQAANSLPASEKQIFICLGEHLDKYPLAKELLNEYSNAEIIRIDKVTEGQACTCEIGLRDIAPESELFIGACDNGMLWNSNKYQKLLDNKDIHCIAFSFSHHVSSKRNPNMYGWLNIDKENNIKKVSVKVPISDTPFNDHAIIGSFYFRKAEYFLKAYEMLVSKNIRVNNEFYVDSLINEIIEMGLNAKVFEAEHYLCWGTPNDLKTYEYWQSFFHKCSWHPYLLKKDVTINKSEIERIDKKYKTHEKN